jgi:dynein heavy chain
MGPPGGGRTRITQRYVRHFNMINFVNFDDDSLARVFGSILDWRLSQGFANPVKGMSESVVKATINIFNTISLNLLPTPIKSHYTFNLRDLSKVFQGLLQGDPNFVKDKDSMIKLWTHECLRVFHDRLIDDIDRNWFQNLVSERVSIDLGADLAQICGTTSKNLVYCNFGDPKSAVSKVRFAVFFEMLPCLELVLHEIWFDMILRRVCLAMVRGAALLILRFARFKILSARLTSF